jgi:GntR family transcriptional regulator
VAEGVLQYDLRSLVSYTEKAIIAGKKPSTEVLRFERMKGHAVPEGIRDILQIDNHEHVYYMERLRLADGRPVILEHRHVAAKYCPKLTKSEVARSLYALWTKKYHLNIIEAEQTIRAINLSPKEARPFKVKTGTAAFEVHSLGYVEHKVPLWWERTLYKGDEYEFHNRIGGITSAHNRTGILRNIMTKDR